MSVQMRACGPAITESDLEALETRIGTQLPKDYKAFMLQYNGGRPTPECFPIQGHKTQSFDSIQLFLGIGGSIETLTFEWNLQNLEQLPPELLPIAVTDCGDRVCLVLSGMKAGAIGSVVYWDFHAAWGTEGYCYDIYAVADSFGEFIESLHDMPD